MGLLFQATECVQQKRNTLARGLRVDFSEDRDPTDELGDNAGPLEVPAAHSEFNDTEQPGRPLEFNI